MPRPDYQVRLSSEEYGEEVFAYASKREARQGYRRVLKSSIEHSNEDGVVRHVELLTVHSQRAVETAPDAEQEAL